MRVPTPNDATAPAKSIHSHRQRFHNGLVSIALPERIGSDVNCGGCMSHAIRTARPDIWGDRCEHTSTLPPWLVQ
jgi:hypothetical protein